jgi:hypothetical protein
MISSLPAINQSFCSGWTPQDRTLYNALPLWMVEQEVKFRQKYGNWRRVFGSFPWTSNVGHTIRGIVSEPPPTLRQFAFPNLTTSPALKDVIQYRERTFDVTLRHHKFESPVFSWEPAFTDFVEKKLTKNLAFILDWQENFSSQFYRGFMFHQSPVMMFCNSATNVFDDTCPIGTGNTAGTDGKSNAYLQAQILQMGSPGNLSIANLFQALNYLEEDSKAVPYQSGSVKDDSFLNDKYLLMTSSEAYNNFINDPFLKENRQLDLDIVEEGFKGSILGRITAALHSNPLRILVSSTGTISFPAPDTIQENPSAPNFGQTIRNPDYRNAQYEVAFLCGAEGYAMVDVGAPPGDFTAENGQRFTKLTWNGKPRVTDRINIPCPDGGTPDANEYGEWMKAISYMVMGVAPSVTRNVLPIVFKRARTITTNLT